MIFDLIHFPMAGSKLPFGRVAPRLSDPPLQAFSYCRDNYSTFEKYRTLVSGAMGVEGLQLHLTEDDRYSVFDE